ncbi:hypothetical protein [Myroides sp. N17-2]|uniref:hypothetical protein n=1 Tax=Myroides sp. N17-2 TaxID=2030799 RepID=UPI0020B15EF2
MTKYKENKEVIQVKPALLTEEKKVERLQKAIQEGLDSGIVKDFDPIKHLEALRSSK